MRRLHASLLLVSGVILSTSACTSIPAYPDDRACSIDTEIVSELLGTEGFTADEQELTDVPLTGSVPGMTSCAVEAGDRRLLVEARVVPDATAESNRATAEAEPTLFEYRGGVGYTRETAINWFCGNVAVRISVTESPAAAPDWQQIAEPVWDEIGCLTYIAPDDAMQPEGWD